MPSATATAASRAATAQGAKVRVARHVDSATRAIVQAYAKAWQQTRDDLVAAAVEAERIAIATGNPLNPAAFRTARLQASLDELGDQLRSLARISGVSVSSVVGPVVNVSPAVLAELGRLAGVSFNLPPAGALRAIVGRTTQKIATDYLVLSAQAEDAMRSGLVRAIGAGQGPRQTSRAIVRAAREATARDLGLSMRDLQRGGVGEALLAEVRGAFAGGLTRSLNIARTELIDAGRQATTESYLANPGLVVGWRWLAALDRRTCPACWAMHNTVHKPDEHQEGHQSCRCTQVPVLPDDEGEDDLGDPAEAFAKLPRQDRLAVMGPERLARLEEGLPFGELVTRRDNPGWRAGHYTRPLRDLPA